MRALCLALLLSASASAQSADRTGFSLGARVYAASLSTDINGDSRTDSGGGIGVEIAYGFTPTVTGFLALGGAGLAGEDGREDYQLGTADLGVRANLYPSARLNPYLTLALTGQTAAFDIVGTDDDLEARGGGVTVGGGVQYSVSRSVSLDAALDLTGGQFTDLSFRGNSTSNFESIDAGLARLRVGIVATL